MGATDQTSSADPLCQTYSVVLANLSSVVSVLGRGDTLQGLPVHFEQVRIADSAGIGVASGIVSIRSKNSKVSEPFELVYDSTATRWMSVNGLLAGLCKAARANGQGPG